MNLQPDHLVERLRTMNRANFVPYLGKAVFLLVRIDASRAKVASGLRESLEAREDFDSGSESSLTLAGTPISDRGLRPKRERPSSNVTMLRRTLERAPHFVVLLAKRTNPRRTGDGIVLGRSKDSDIVLKDRSVSQRHARLDCDDQGTYYIIDEKSTNGTRVNGKLIAPREWLDVYPGDTMKLGDVTFTMAVGASLLEAIGPAK
jgi:hypothetical protein